MPSFSLVNYSLRPSKSIQRQLVFNGIKMLQSELDLNDPLYVGFGSVWFTDFTMAHKMLGVRDMISIEGNDIGFKRAEFNAPYATVKVRHGHSNEILPNALAENELRSKQWIVWLDYDYPLNETVCIDIRNVIEKAPINSILLVTFNGAEMKYGKVPERVQNLRDVLGAVVPDELSNQACREDRMQETLADLTRDFMLAAAAEVSRPGGFVPGFRIIYQDGAPMVTVGGILPAKGAAMIAGDIVARPTWPGRPPNRIIAPHLTIREAASLQSQLPCDEPLSRASVQALGFDLETEELEAYERYYREYPSFAQILS